MNRKTPMNRLMRIQTYWQRQILFHLLCPHVERHKGREWTFPLHFFYKVIDPFHEGLLFKLPLRELLTLSQGWLNFSIWIWRGPIQIMTKNENKNFMVYSFISQKLLCGLSLILIHPWVIRHQNFLNFPFENQWLGFCNAAKFTNSIIKNKNISTLLKQMIA